MSKQQVKVKSVGGGTPTELPSLVQVQKGEQRQGKEEDVFLEMYGEKGLLSPPFPQMELYNMVEYSSILQQCIEAYRRNIVGFGAVSKYSEDLDQEEISPEMEDEKETLKSFIKYFNFDQSFEDVWGDAIENRERTGNGYIEIVRDGIGLPAEGHSLHPATMRCTPLQQERVAVTQVIDGVTVTRQKRFRKYAQHLKDGVLIWFKEINDPRYMNSKTGEYTPNHNGIEEATEIVHLKLGGEAYGKPRWIGQLIHMYGARKAEELNYNYFYNGRHNPAALIVNNGLLTEESIQQLEDYSKKVQGTENAHKFLVIEVQGTETGLIPGEDKPTGVKAEFKSLADMLQQDALFLEYDEKSREKVQSSFRLPDIYVGRSKDFNRATADTARFITEEQVFQPERNSLEFIINKQILRDYQLQVAEVVFNKPEISDITDLVEILRVANDIGSVAPNDIRELLGQYLGKEIETFDEDIADLPVKIANMLQAQAKQEQQQAQQQPPSKGNVPPKGNNVQKELIEVLKEIRDEVELAYGQPIEAIRKARTNPES